MDNQMHADGGVAPGPVRKVPGPASKTLMTRKASGTGTRLNIVSQPRSYSSAVSGERTVPASPRSNLTNNAAVNGVAPTKEKTFPEKVKTSCLLCLDPVIFALLREDGPLDTENLKQLVTNLCDHMELDHKQLPSEFTRVKFPFCDTCIEQVEEILECHKIIEDAKARIARAITTIERFAADAEIIHPNNHVQPMSSSAAQMDQQRFSKLRDMILEVYRKKLIVQKNLRKNLVVQVQPDEPKDNHNINLKNQFSTFEDFSKIGSKSNDLESIHCHHEEVEDMSTDANSMDINSSTEKSAEESALQVGNDCESLQEEEDWESGPGQNLSADEDLPLNPDARYDENNCTLVRSNVRGGNKPSIVKQETSCASPDGNEIEGNGFTAPPTPIAIGTGSEKQKMIIGGIKIYRGTYPNGRDYLQCGRCTHRIPNTKYHEKKTVSAYVRMKIHIMNTHQRNRKQGPVKRQQKIVSVPSVAKKTKVFSCPSCKKQFSDLTSLRAHKKTHLIPLQECDICGRLVKGWLKNLMTHKFTHKNDEERRAAIAAGELGANHTLLSKKVKTPLFRNKVQKYVPQPKKYKGKPKKQVAAVGSTANNVAPAANFCCRFCPRKFDKKCYLSIHTKTHISGSNPKPPKPSNRVEANAFGAQSHSSVGLERMDLAVPSGSNLDDIELEENDMFNSSDEAYGWVDEEEEQN